jgi:hypothetical protein
MCGKRFITREKGRSVTYVILVIVAALLLGGLWYVRGRRA